MNQNFTRIAKQILTTISFVIVCGCQQIPSNWTTESLDKKHVSWDGSYDNSDKLKLLYHGVKFYKEKDSYEWAFKVNLFYPKNYDDDTSGTYAKKMGLWTPPSNAELCIPVNKIRYEIYDSDDFLIDSMSIAGNCITYTDTVTYQSKKKISKDLIAKFKYGRINVQAGYYYEKK